MLKKSLLVFFCAIYAFFLIPSYLPQQSFTTAAQSLPPVNYDIVYVRAIRSGDNQINFLPEALTPLLPEPGADLMLLHPDGSEEVIFAAGANGAVMDPYISYDGRSVTFAYFPNLKNSNSQRRADYNSRELSREGADIYRIDLPTRKVTRLTHQESSPNTGNGAIYDCSKQFQSNCPEVGVFNTGPAFLPDGRIVYTSTRDNYIPNKPKVHTGLRTMQLWVMDGDGKNQHTIGHFNLASAMHPFVLKDGRIVFSTWENMGSRDDRSFMLWSIWPDGTNFDTFSGFGDADIAHHFMTQLGNGDIVVNRYYNLNNNGFGELYRFPVNTNSTAPLFQPIPDDKTPDDEIPMKRVGYTRITPFTTADDYPAPCFPGALVSQDPCPNGNASRVGKFTLPSAAPNNELLVTYAPGSANHKIYYNRLGLTQPYYDAGIYRMHGDKVMNAPSELVLIKNDPRYHELWPRAVVPYQQIYGVTAPADLPKMANDGKADSRLPEGTPLALVGSSSLISRDTRPFQGDPFFQHWNNGNRNWTFQGADAGVYSDNDIYALRVIAMQPTSDLRYPDNYRGYTSNFNERIRILGEIPVRKEGVIDSQGNVDTSFLAKIPSDTPFTFQTLDRNGLVLNSAQTWHSLQPGEVRINCGGCHAHTKPLLDFSKTAAAKPDYQIRDLSQTTPLLRVDGSANPGVAESAERFATVEYFRDIKPIFQAKCASCHSSNGITIPAGNLDLADNSLVEIRRASDQIPDGYYPAAYATLAIHKDPMAGPSPRSFSPLGDWYWPQVTKYIRAGQARQSLLAWKIFGRRLDGRTNADRPSPTDPSNPATIPGGLSFYDCDLDYTGEQMPPPNSGLTLTWDERMKIARWIDIGCPIDLTTPNMAVGWKTYAAFLEDDLRPTLSLIPSVAEATKARRLSRFVIGAYDLESGINPATLSVTMDRAVGNFPAGTNIAANATIINGGTVVINLPTSIDLVAAAVTVAVEIRDQAGHTTRILRTYSRDNTNAVSVSAASYSPQAPVATEAIVSAFGTNLAMESLPASSLPLPTTLAGTSVIVKDNTGTERLAPLFFVSPSQINYQVPPGTATGPASIIITNSEGFFASGTIQVGRIMPGLFAADATGRGLAAGQIQRARSNNSTVEAIVRFDSAQNKFVSVPIDLGPATDQVYLILYGTGLRFRSALTAVKANVGGIAAEVTYAGAQNDYVGLDQVNLLLPRTLIGRGEVDVSLTVDGQVANTIRVNIR
ncbi:MAG: PD40 domain-containing protein [Acidobacteria bacterium]|nr:PD40 domain-containing protein [Acidobacteriota bacterium]